MMHYPGCLPCLTLVLLLREAGRVGLSCRGRGGGRGGDVRSLGKPSQWSEFHNGLYTARSLFLSHPLPSLLLSYSLMYLIFPLALSPSRLSSSFLPLLLMPPPFQNSEAVLSVVWLTQSSNAEISELSSTLLHKVCHHMSVN